MVQNSLEIIKNEFKTRYIFVPDQWFEEILNKQQENVTCTTLSLNYDYFYKKWLETNLLTLDYSSLNFPNHFSDYSLPPNKFIINATFQIIRVQDLSKPKPNDFCEDLYIKQKNSEKDSEEQFCNLQNDEKFINCKRRQLFFELFNGKKIYKAFEFEVINQINFQNCYPGAKLLIKGEVEQSLNVFQLKADNIILLGGTRLEIIIDQ